MDLIETLGAAIVTGSALGASVAGFFAYKQGLTVKVLRELVGDYEKRIKQLEEERTRDHEAMKNQTQRIEALENEKRLPLDELTKLIIKQHSEQLESTNNIATTMSGVATQMGKVAEQMAGRGAL